MKRHDSEKKSFASADEEGKTKILNNNDSDIFNLSEKEKDIKSEVRNDSYSDGEDYSINIKRGIKKKNKKTLTKKTLIVPGKNEENKDDIFGFSANEESIQSKIQSEDEEDEIKINNLNWSSIEDCKYSEETRYGILQFKDIDNNTCFINIDPKQGLLFEIFGKSDKEYIARIKKQKKSS